VIPRRIFRVRITSPAGDEWSARGPQDGGPRGRRAAARPGRVVGELRLVADARAQLLGRSTSGGGRRLERVERVIGRVERVVARGLRSRAIQGDPGLRLLHQL